MKLIGDIINELINSESSLEPPLLKTKVLAARIGNPELQDWVEKEIIGYGKYGHLPDYRQSTTIVVCNTIQESVRHLDVVVPTVGLTEKQEDSLIILNWEQGIKSIEAQVRGYQGGILLKNKLPAGFYKLIELGFKSVGILDITVLSAWRETTTAAVEGILSAVRYRLLDFLLKLESEFGEQVEIEQLKTNKGKVTNIMNQTINNNGDGNVVNTGNDATLHINISITKGDKDALRAKLLDNKVAPVDVEELLSIVDEETPNGDSFGSKVNSWLGKMLMKATNGSWQIAAGAAGNILATLLQQYYGISS